MTWNPATGFYISAVKLDAPWESELASLEFPKYDEFIITEASARKINENYNFLSFKSIDGKSSTIKPRDDRGEYPEDYTWTDAYYSNPAIRSVIDWFKVEKTKTRIFQQVPGGHIAFHYDWDNQRLNFDSSELTVRIWVQLDGNNCNYRLSNGDVDVTISLQRGQFIVLNTDTVFHETWNHGTCPRNLLNITCRANSWLKNMYEIWREPGTIKTMEQSLGIN